MLLPHPTALPHPAVLPLLPHPAVLPNRCTWWCARKPSPHYGGVRVSSPPPLPCQLPPAPRPRKEVCLWYA